MTLAIALAAYTETLKLINHYHDTLTPEQAQAKTQRFEEVLDFLFGWIRKLHDHDDKPAGT